MSKQFCQVFIVLIMLIVSPIFAAERKEEVKEVPRPAFVSQKLQRAPSTPRAALREARAKNIVARRLGKPEIPIEKPLIMEAANRFQEKSCCCWWGCCGAICIVLCNGCCYQPSADEIYCAQHQFWDGPTSYPASLDNPK